MKFANKMAKKKDLNTKIARNYLFVSLFFGVVIFAVFYRIIIISFVEGDSWRKLGELQVRPNIKVSAARGNIYSSDHQLMATTEYRYRLYMDFWADGLKVDTLNKYVDDLSVELSKMLPQRSAQQHKRHIMAGWEMRQKEAKQIETNGKAVKKSREYRLFKEDIDYLQLKKLRQMPFFKKGVNATGLYSKSMVRRIKPYGTLASRTIGDIYAEFDKGGSSGLENHYNDILTGEPGVSTRRKVNGRWMNTIDVNPINGSDIISTIDITTQEITEKALLDKVTELDAESATAIVMEVETGEIKAIANMGRVREGVWRESRNFAVSDLSEPGSTFKVASMMVALEDGVIKPDDIIETGNGVFPYGGSTVYDHNANRGGYGTITADKAIRYSSNVGIAKIILRGYENNPSKFVEGIYRIGIQKDLDLEIPGYGVPNIRHPKDSVRYWSRTALPWMSFGYETQVPPISTLTFFNAIANNGKMMKPLFTKEIQREGKTIETKRPVVINEEICSDKTLNLIRQMLDDVVNMEDGTGKPAHSSKVRIAGKTGTAQISQGKSGYRSGQVSHQVSFCGYFPSDKPKYSCIVIVRKPRNGAASGGNMCGTVLKKIAEDMYARNLIYKKNGLPVDSLHSPIPLIKNGVSDQSRYAMDKLNIDFKDDTKGSWMIAQNTDDKVVLTDNNINKDLIPNVVGMGAKDAVYLLEQVGLRVNLSGKGTVRSQSRDPGSKLVKGETIAIQLR